jgi:poly-gamma-glutamate synthesis protein (capsule biosynthesis protein)
LTVRRSVVAAGRIKLKAVGDITLVSKRPSSPFVRVANVLADKDILFGNLETVLSNSGRRAQKAIVLNANPEKVAYLKDAGFDVLNMANNHSMDLGAEGLDETIAVLQESGMAFVGASNRKHRRTHWILRERGLNLGFLGYFAMGFRDEEKGQEVCRMDLSRMIRDIEDLRGRVDVVIVSLHWGIESVFYPSPEQIRAARGLIDAGASVVIGHGPRVVQGVERYKQGVIAYSLGNFQFDFDHEIVVTDKVKESVILSLTLSQDGVEDYDIVPVRISDDYIPYPMDGLQKEASLAFVAKISKAVQDGHVTKAWWFEQIARTYLRTNTYSWRVRMKQYGFMHALQYARWLASPFVVRCYGALLVKALKRGV